MTSTRSLPLVVGVDRGARSTSAVVWAAEETERSGRPVRLVTAVPSLDDADDLRDGLARLARRLVLGDLTTTVREGTATEVLVDAADGAWALVIGRRGFGSVQRLLLGSTSRTVAERSPAPVVVVPEAWMQPSMSSAPVVVGIEPCPDDRWHSGDPDWRVLHFAFERADRARVPLIVVSTTAGPSAAGTGTSYDESLRRRLAPWRGSWPRVEVAPRSSDGPPARALAEAGALGQLTVLGRHSGRRPVVSFGTTTRHLLQSAERPVAVIPATVPGPAYVGSPPTTEERR